MGADNRFLRFAEILIDRNEKGYVNDPDDPGLETKYGISKKTYPALDIPNLSRDEAIENYRRDFWFGQNLHLVKNDTLAFKLFDSSVPMGQRQMALLVQRALLVCGMTVTVDGEIGPDTIGAINNCDQVKLYAEYVKRCYLFLKGLKTFVKYGCGWTSRLLDVA